MKCNRESVVAFFVLAAVLVAGAAGLAPELTVSRVDLNDNVFHLGLIEGMAQAIERHQNPFDWWAPDWVMGYPVLRTYQPLAHAIVVLIYFALGKTVSLMTVFVWVRYLSVVLLPLTFFVTARLMGFSPLTAAAAALLAPLISTPGLYGIEYGSYLWAGFGVFTQAVACHFFLLTIGFAFRAICQGRHLGVTGALLGLTFLSHFIYGYMAALTVCLLALVPASESSVLRRIARTAWIGALAFALASFQLVPLLLDRSLINHSRWEYVWKWDSFGATQVLKWLFTGELLDHGRFPALSLLALLGVVVYFAAAYSAGLRRLTEGANVPAAARRERPAPVAQLVTAHRGSGPERSSVGIRVADKRRETATVGTAVGVHNALSRYPARTFVILSAVLWILMFFGRPFWGSILTLLGVSEDMQLHRVVGGAQVFLVLLAAVGLSAIWKFLVNLNGPAAPFPASIGVGAAILATGAMLYPMARERATYLSNNSTWGRTSLAIYEANKGAIDAAIAMAKERGGRVYTGLPATWGGKFKVGDPPFYAYVSMAQVPALSFMYHSMSLPSEIMTRLNEFNPDHYRLFDIQTVIAPVYNRPALPGFLTPLAGIGPFQILGAPGGGYFDLVEANYSVRSSRKNFYDVNDRWLQSDWVAKRQHLVLDFYGDAPTGTIRLPDNVLPSVSATPLPGAILAEHQEGGDYETRVAAGRPSFVLFKMTWHPNWKAKVDGQPIKTVMLTPGFVGVPVPAGLHRILLRYEPEPWKGPLALLGLLFVLAVIVREERGRAKTR